MLIRTIDRSLSNIHFERIMYIEYLNRNAIFHMKDGSQIVCNMSLNKANELFPALQRPYHSVLLNESELRSIRVVGAFYYFKLSNGEKLKVSLSSANVKSFISRNKGL